MAEDTDDSRRVVGKPEVNNGAIGSPGGTLAVIPGSMNTISTLITSVFYTNLPQDSD